MNIKKVILGEKVPDKDDPNYKKRHEEGVEVDVHVKYKEVYNGKRQKAEDEKSSAKYLFAFRVVDVIPFQLTNLHCVTQRQFVP